MEVVIFEVEHSDRSRTGDGSFRSSSASDSRTSSVYKNDGPISVCLWTPAKCAIPSLQAVFVVVAIAVTTKYVALSLLTCVSMGVVGTLWNNSVCIMCRKCRIRIPASTNAAKQIAGHLVGKFVKLVGGKNTDEQQATFIHSPGKHSRRSSSWLPNTRGIHVKRVYKHHR